MSPHAIEIERKFRLRVAPAPAMLAASDAVALRIRQVYIGNGRNAERLRRVETADGVVTFRLTRKRRIGAYAFEEQEEAIDEAAWLAGLERADPSRRPIHKTRHVVPHGEQQLEIDVFDEPADLVVVEVELQHEDEPVELPAWLGEWAEVTGDERYFNAVIARLDGEVPAWETAGPGARTGTG